MFLGGTNGLYKIDFIYIYNDIADLKIPKDIKIGTIYNAKENTFTLPSQYSGRTIVSWYLDINHQYHQYLPIPTITYIGQVGDSLLVQKTAADGYVGHDIHVVVA